MQSFIQLIPADPQHLLATFALAGGAAGFFAGYLRCLAKKRRCSKPPAMSFRERLNTMFWSVTDGLLTSIGGHWVVSTGAAERIIRIIEQLVEQSRLFLPSSLR